MALPAVGASFSGDGAMVLELHARLDFLIIIANVNVLYTMCGVNFACVSLSMLRSAALPAPVSDWLPLSPTMTTSQYLQESTDMALLLHD